MFKKKMTLITDVFRKLQTPKNIDQCLKSHVSKYPSKSNMANVPKHCSNLKDSPFTTFIDHWEVNCPTKSLY